MDEDLLKFYETHYGRSQYKDLVAFRKFGSIQVLLSITSLVSLILVDSDYFPTVIPILIDLAIFCCGIFTQYSVKKFKGSTYDNKYRKRPYNLFFFLSLLIIILSLSQAVYLIIQSKQLYIVTLSIVLTSSVLLILALIQFFVSHSRYYNYLKKDAEANAEADIPSELFQFDFRDKAADALNFSLIIIIVAFILFGPLVIVNIIF